MTNIVDRVIWVVFPLQAVMDELVKKFGLALEDESYGTFIRGHTSLCSIETNLYSYCIKLGDIWAFVKSGFSSFGFVYTDPGSRDGGRRIVSCSFSELMLTSGRWT